MTCEKCGLQISLPEKTCPRCGELLPKPKIQREGIEEGSIDAWSPNAAESDTRGRGAMPEIPLVSKLTQKHPSAPFYIGALLFRACFYIINLVLLLFSNFSFWTGWGIIINILIALVSVAMVVIPLEDHDIYLFKIISTIIILLDAGVVVVSWLLPYVLKIIAIVF